MANKQITRPGNRLLPSWANDENINDPGQPWDATPTKVEPGAGKRDDGFLPEENPTAQHLNLQLNELSKWTQYFSNMQVLNWTGTEPTDGTINTCEALVYDEGAEGLFVGGRANVIHFRKGFVPWILFPASPVPATWTHGASKPPDDVPTHVGIYTVMGAEADDEIIAIEPLGYTAIALPGAAFTRSTYSMWDPDFQQWVIVGSENSGGDPSFWFSSHPIAALTQFTLPTVNSSNVVMFARASTDHPSGAPLYVAIGEQAAPNHDVWTSTDGQVWTQAVPTGINAGQTMRAIVWDPARTVFVLTTDDDVYTSTNGTSWSPVATGLPGTFPDRCLATDGGGLLVSLNNTGAFALRYSDDGGITWRVVYLPAGMSGPPGVGGQIIYSRSPSRFFATFVDPPNQGFAAFSFALGDSLYTVGNVFSPPTVT